METTVVDNFYISNMSKLLESLDHDVAIHGYSRYLPHTNVETKK